MNELITQEDIDRACARAACARTLVRVAAEKLGVLNAESALADKELQRIMEAARNQLAREVKP